MKTPLMILLLVLFSLGATGCSPDGPMERAGESIDKAADDVSDGVKDAADEVEDAID